MAAYPVNLICCQYPAFRVPSTSMQPLPPDTSTSEEKHRSLLTVYRNRARSNDHDTTLPSHIRGSLLVVPRCPCQSQSLATSKTSIVALKPFICYNPRCTQTTRKSKPTLSYSIHFARRRPPCVHNYGPHTLFGKDIRRSTVARMAYQELHKWAQELHTFVHTGIEKP